MRSSSSPRRERSEVASTAGLHVTSETGRLRRVMVNGGGSLLDPAEARMLHEKYGAHIAQEAHHHPEGDAWDADRVRAQHEAFVSTLSDEGVHVVMAPDVPEAPYGMFTRDIGFVVGDTLYQGNLGDGVRRREQEPLGQLDGLGRITPLAEGIVEGGDVLVDGDVVLVGVTHRSTDQAGFRGIARHLMRKGIQAVPIRCGPPVLHLDCRLGLLPRRYALLHDGDVHPEDASWLKKRYNVIPVEQHELRTLATNVVCISESKIVMDPRNARIIRRLRNEGFDIIEVPYDEVTKLWGAFHCTTLPLHRDPPK